jgi:hypothetical protein
MKIEGKEVLERHIYSPVTYVPAHANGNAGHKDCEQGVLIGVTANDDARVLYCTGRTIQVTDPSDLVWG